MSRLVSFAILYKQESCAATQSRAWLTKKSKFFAPSRLAAQRGAGSVSRRRPLEKSVPELAPIIIKRALFSQLLAPCFKLTLDQAKFGKCAVPIRFQTANLIAGEVAHTADRYATLKHTHRFAGYLRDDVQLTQNVFGFLQKVAADLGELPFLFRGDNRLGFIQTVGDEVVEFLPVIQLQSNQAQFRLEFFIAHRNDF